MDYAQLRTTGKNLIDKYGVTFTLNQGGSTTTGKLLQTKKSLKDAGGGTNDRKGEFLVSGLISTAPAVGGIIDTGASKFRITEVEIVQPGAVVLLYKVIAE